MTRDCSHLLSLTTFIVVCAGLAIPTSGADETSAAGIVFEADIPCGLGGEQSLSLDLARPESASADHRLPCIVAIHGGAWRGGNKEQLRTLIRQLAERGYVAASVQYRLCPQHLFPAQVEDVKCAVRFLRAHRDDYGIDPDRFGAVGFSAGAHLAMLLGVMDPQDGLHGDGGWPDESDQVQAVVSWFGPTELAADDIPEVSLPLVRDFIGGTAAEKPDEFRRASPITYVTRGDAPMLLFQGTQDRLVPFSQAWRMTQRMQDHQVRGRVELLVGADHGWGGEELERTLESTFDFLQQHLETPTLPDQRRAAHSPAPHSIDADTRVLTTAEENSAAVSADEDGFVPLFDGASFDGWNGDPDVFRIDERAIVGGQLNDRIPHNYFLATDNSYGDFDLRLEFRLIGDNTNAGVQLRSRRIPDHHEMIGYQADLGQNYWGCLYDESRRNKVLARPDAAELDKILRRGEWNSYRILCEGRRIRLWINDQQTVDYTEEDPEIDLQGQIALQIHGGDAGEAWYRNIRLKAEQPTAP